MAKPIIYVAGPLSAPTNAEMEQHIKNAADVGCEIWRMGGVAIVPHLNTLHMGQNFKGIPDEAFYSGDLEILERCDAMYQVKNWRGSRGTCYETFWANTHSIPILTDLDDTRKFVHRFLARPTVRWRWCRR